MTKKSWKNIFRNILKIIGIVLGSFIGLILIFSILLLSFLEPVAEKYLKKQVFEQSDGLYAINFDKLQLNLFTLSATLENPHLVPDTSLFRKQIDSGSAGNNVFEMEARTVKISRIGIFDVLFFNQLNIGSIFIDRPDILMISADDAKKDDFIENDADDKPANNFNFINIGEVEISDASFRNQMLNAPFEVRHDITHASVLLDDLQIDFQKNNNPNIEVTEITFQMEGYEFQSPDKVYNVSVSLLAYASDSGELMADSIKISADHQENQNLNLEDAHRTIINLIAPQLVISGLDILQAHHSKKLIIDHFMLENPLIEILENSQIPAKNGRGEMADLYPYFSEFLEVIEIRNLNLKKGELSVQRKLDEILKVHQLENFDIAVHSLRLDSNVFANPRENVIFEDISFLAKRYSFTPPQSPYKIQAKNINLNSLDQYFQADSIQIIGDWKQNELLKPSNQAVDMVYNIEAARFQINNLDLGKSFMNQRLDIGSISLEQPAIDILVDRHVQVKENDANLKEIFEEVSGFVSKINIEKIEIKDAAFTHHIRKKNHQIRRVQKLEHASIVMQGIFIDSSFIFQKVKKIPVNNIVLVAHNYIYWTPDDIHTFSLDRVRFSSQKEELTARFINIDYNREANNSLKPSKEAHRKLYNIYASKFRVGGLNLISSLNSGRLSVDQILLQNPKLTLLLDRNVSPSPSSENQEEILSDLFSIFHTITVKSLAMEGGSFTFNEKREEIFRTHILEHASANVVDLHLTTYKASDLEDVLPFEDIILIAKDYHYRSPDNIYSIRMDSLKYSSRLQLLSANFIDVISDKEEHERIKQKDLLEANRNLVDLSADKIRMSGFDLVHAYETGEFFMKELLISQPEIVVLQDKNVPEKNKSDKENDDKDVFEQVADIVETFKVEHLRLEDGTLQLNTLIDSVMGSQRIEHVSLSVDHLRLANLEANDPLDMFEMNDLELVVRDYNFILPDSLYVFKVSELRSSLSEKSVSVTDLRLVPLFEIEEYPDRLQFVADRFDIHVVKARMQNINLRALFNNQDLIVENINLENIHLDVYRDERLDRDPERRPLTLQSLLRKADFYIKADTIALENFDIAFSSIPINGEEPVILLLENSNMEIINVTNDSSIIEKNNMASVQAMTQFMGESKLQLDIQLYLDHPDDLYSYEGSLESMAFDALNPLFENLMPIRFTEGNIQKIEFSVDATEHEARGNMHFFYEDLKVQIIDKDNPDNPGFWIRTGTWLVNNFMIKSNNPTNRGRFREGDIEIGRDYEKSVFNHMGEAMMDGIGSSVMTPFVEKVVNIFVGD